MDFWRVADIINKRKWFLVLSVLVTTALTWGVTRLIGSKWQATVQFVSPQASPLVSGQASEGSGEPQSDGQPSMEGAKAQAIIYAAIVKSRDVLEPSLKKLDQRQLPPDLLKNIDFVASAPRLFQLQVADSNRNRAQVLANELAHNFVDVYHRVRTRQAASTVTLLETQVKDAEARLNTARSRYDSYRSARHIVGTLNANLDVAMARLSAARQKQDEIAEKIADAQGRLNKIASDMARLPRLVSVKVPAPPSPRLGQMQDERDKLDEQIGEARAHLTDDSPALQKLLLKKENLAVRIKTERENLAGTTYQQTNPALVLQQQQQQALQQEMAGYVAQKGRLVAAVTAASAEINNYRGIDSPLGALAGDVSTQLEARNNIAARLHNARMTQDATEGQTPIAIMDEVNDFNPPVNASKGRSSKLLVIAALCSLLATSGLIITLDSIDRRLKTVNQAEIVLPAPILAAIPQPMGDVSYSSLARATELHPQSIHAEAFRFLGLQLLNKKAAGPHSLMVLSAKAEQGSTTVLTNLGITLAQAGQRVVLVDANVRTAELHQVFELPNEYGYMDLLATPTEEAFARAMQPTTVAGLSVITSGIQPANPWEVFRSRNIVEVAHHLRDKADFILYDTPSSVIFTDALNLAPVVDAAFLCVRALEPLTGAEDRVVKLAQEAQVPVLGCVLNDVPSSVVSGYENYQHYYQPNANARAVAESGKAPSGGTSARPGQGLQRWIDVPGENTPGDSKNSRV